MKDYVAKNKDKMGFSVAADDKLKTVKSWMEAAVMDGIPSIFIVNARLGNCLDRHPFEMTEPLEAILKGIFTANRARVILRFLQATNRESAATFRNLDQYNETIGKALQLIYLTRKNLVNQLKCSTRPFATIQIGNTVSVASS